MNDVLKKALELLDDGAKWTNDVRNGPRNCYCVYTALLEAHRQVFKTAGERGFTFVELGANPAGAERMLRAAGLHTLTDLFGWNDAPGRTWEEVKKLFNDAIALYPYLPSPGEDDEDPRAGGWESGGSVL